MATENQVLDVLILLVDANLNFPPRDIEGTARVWQRLLQDVPGEALERAALDYITVNREFPKIAEIRKAARLVVAHNGQSAAPNPWKDDSAPRKARMARFPAEVEAAIKALEEKYYDAGLPTDDELTGIDQLTRGYL